MNILKTKGDPLYRFYYANVKKVTALSKHKVRFEFDKKGNRELPLIVGQFPIFPKHYWQGKDFAHTTLKPLLGSGPYKIKSVKPNKSIVFERVKNYWAKDLPVNKGNYNFDEIRVEMYRETTVAFEAFKAGEYDYFTDISAKNWTQNYNFAAVNNGFIKKEIFKRLHPQPMQGLVFNLRKEKFKDRKVREALNYLMDFDWMNQNLFYNSYKRTRSYFQSSELEAKGLPSKEELAILEPYKNKLPQEVFTQEYNPPSIDPQKGFRMNMRQAQKLLMDAGYTVKGGKLYDKKGKPFDIEILITESSFERALSPMVETMQKIGIHVNLRLIDQAQYVRRLQNFDYDMIVAAFAQSSSPGNEQREFWGSTSANRSSSRNYIGIQDPIIDSLIERIVFAKHRDDLIVATKALDRVLQWGFYLIPQWYADGDRIAYWNKFGKPEMANSYANGFPNLWWYDKEKADLINLPKK
jgi:microcin C transport system substrate-binding protein